MLTSIRAVRRSAASRTDLRLEDYIKTGGAAVAVLYGLGLAVSVFYFNGYGVVHVSFAKPQYILTGFWLVAPVLCGATTVFLAGDMLRAAKAGAFDRPWKWLPKWLRRANAYVAALWGSILLGATPFILLTVVILQTFDAPHFNPDNAGCVTVPAGLMTVLVLALLRSGRRSARAIRYDDKKLLTPGVGWALASVTLSAMFIVGYVVVFTAMVYPGIPAAVGGGQPRRVRLLLKSPQTLAVLGFKDSKEAPKPLWLLAETDTSYIFLVNLHERETVTISRDAVAAVVAQP